MKTKHILPLTCERKIDAVREGRCTQTIRTKKEDTPKKSGHWIKFHGWKDRPYYSEWNWRTPYWRITEARPLRFELTDNTLGYYRENAVEESRILLWSYSSNRYHVLNPSWCEEIAIRDGLDSYAEMVEWLLDNSLNKVADLFTEQFRMIRWNTKEPIKHQKSTKRHGLSPETSPYSQNNERFK